MPSFKPVARLLAIVLLAGPLSAMADETSVAVAANFTAAAQDIAKAFHDKTGDTAVLSFGSTGTLYTQISNGAPFQVFLAADNERPEKAVTDGLGVDGSCFTYAKGKVVLYSSTVGLVDDKGEVLKMPDHISKLAIANPAAAPYGAAAIEVMKTMGVYDKLQPKIVEGNNISQAWQFTSTGTATLGFVALSQVINVDGGSRWIVPDNLYTPIRQDAVLLNTGKDSKAAKAFLEFLKGPEAHKIIESYGYGLD